MIDDTYSFGPFRIDRTSMKLQRDGVDLPLRQKAVRLLAVLLERAGEVVSYDELGVWVWQGSYTDENTIKATVSSIRKTLGHEYSGYIKSLPRIGYRFNHPEQGDELPPLRRPKLQKILLSTFKDFTGDQGKVYLAPSITFELEKALSRIEGIHVIRASLDNMHFLSDRQRGEIKYMVTGSVAGTEGRPRVEVELLAMPESRVVWIDSYPTTFSRLQELHAQIAAKIAGVIQKKIDLEEMMKLSDEKVDRQAYKLYLRGLYHWNRPTEVDLFRAVNCFHEATTRETTFARAFGAMAHAYGLMALGGFLPPDSAMPQARDAALKCLELLPRSPEGLAGLAAVQSYYLWNWQDSEKLLKRSIAANPEYETAHHLYAMGCLLPQTRFKEALREINRAEEINPLSPFIITCTGIVHYYNRDTERALNYFDRALELQPQYHLAHWHRGWTLAELKRPDEAIFAVSTGLAFSNNSPQVLAALGYVFALADRGVEARRILGQLKKISRERYVSPYDLALIHAALQNDPKTLTLLKSAVDQRSPMLARLTVHPVFDRFRSNSKFHALLQAMHLLPGNGSSVVDEGLMQRRRRPRKTMKRRSRN